MEHNPTELVHIDVPELTRILEDQFEQEDDPWDLVKEQPPLHEMPAPSGAAHEWPVEWLNVCNWLYECSPMVPQRVWTPPGGVPRGDGLKAFVPFGRVVGFGEYARYGVHVSDLDRNDEHPGSFAFLENPLGSELMGRTQSHFTLHLQWPGFEHEERISSGSPGTARVLRLSIAAETRNFLWAAYKKMAQSDLSTHLNAWHPARVPWTRLRILGLAQLADGHWQPVLYLSTEYAELPAPAEYEALRATMHAQLVALCAAEGRSQELAALLGNMHLKGASEELAAILGGMRLGGAHE
ncbi:hypothetical protein PsYK624_073000 [Phanerochaete sordida]|uniref:Uncharacterized protein n=1 Tax=Phanerochaete sordida TaxID=48140 RepID=A0A9P3LD44_9APHY|nr:hypothetical protein PsYK624_073000 [Phanerochaete sordida]